MQHLMFVLFNVQTLWLMACEEFHSYIALHARSWMNLENEIEAQVVHIGFCSNLRLAPQTLQALAACFPQSKFFPEEILRSAARSANIYLFQLLNLAVKAN